MVLIWFCCSISINGFICLFLLSGHHHEDGTQSDSEDPVLKGRSTSHHSVQSEQSEVLQQTVQSGQSIYCQPPAPTQKLHQPLQYSPPSTAPASPVAPERPLSQSPTQAPSPTTETQKQGPPESLTQQAFIIEFFDDNPRKKRSQSFTHNPAHADSYSALKAKMERRKGSERPASVHGHIPPTQQMTVPLKGQSHSGPQRSSSLKREKTEGEAASSNSSSRSSSGIVIRPFGSVGKKSKLAQDFATEFLKDSSRQDSSPTREMMSPPPMSAPPVMVSPPHARIPSPQEPLAPSSVSYPSSPLQPLAVLKSSIPTNAGQTTSPVRSSGPHMSSMLSHGIRAGDMKGSQRTVRNEEDDSLSDAGTYTIEAESQDKEVEEARNMIDQVKSPRPWVVLALKVLVRSSFSRFESWAEKNLYLCKKNNIFHQSSNLVVFQAVISKEIYPLPPSPNQPVLNTIVNKNTDQDSHISLLVFEATQNRIYFFVRQKILSCCRDAWKLLSFLLLPVVMVLPPILMHALCPDRCLVSSTLQSTVMWTQECIDL